MTRKRRRAPSGGHGAAVVQVKREVRHTGRGAPLVLAALSRLLPSDAYNTAVEEAYDFLMRALRRAFGPRAELTVFGSILQSSHARGSDVDVCVRLPGTPHSVDGGPLDNSKQVAALRRLLATLPRQLSVVETRLSKTIRVPIVILEYARAAGERIEVDVSIGNMQDGIQKGATDRIVRRLLAKVPRALPFVRLVKAWAKNEGLHKAFDGFLNSLGWTLLVLFFFMLRGEAHPDMMLDEEQNENNVLPPPLHRYLRDAPDISDIACFFEMVAGFRVAALSRQRGISLVEGGEVEGPGNERSPFFIEDPGARILAGRQENVARALRDETWRTLLQKCQEAVGKLRGATAEAFDQAARWGRALLIENATAGAAMAGWSCDRLAKEFPKARMRREYDWVKNPEDINLVRMGDSSWIETTAPGQDAKERLKQDEKAPPFAPFYWGVREHYNSQNPVGTKETVKRIKSLIAESVPGFMDKGSGKSMFENTEFWLGGKGTGARAHMDSHCISTLSFVLHGERRWRIGPVPRLPKGAGRSPDGEVVFDDGVAYRLGWKPMFEFVAKEGDAVLFPPGWIHETMNTAEDCTVALTTQFDIPWPARYYRNYYQRLRRVGDLHPCWRQMVHTASLGDQQATQVKAADAPAYAERLYARRNTTLSTIERDFYDVDGDGTVTKEEFVQTFVEWVHTEAAVRREKTKRIPKVDMSLDAAAPQHATEL